jgi:nucleoid-associated protein YgaU
MRRSSASWPDPEAQRAGLLARVWAGAAGLLEHLRGGQPEQALPLSRYHGQGGPVMPYHERQQMLRARRRGHGAYALIFIVVVLVLVLGLYYGLSWALGGFTQTSAARATATPVAPTSTAAPVAAPISPIAVLPTAAPGGTAPGPSPAAVVAPAAPPPAVVAPAAPPATPEPVIYIVRSGDNPDSIARRFGLRSEDIMRANNIRDERTLQPGQRLTIPPTPTPAR